eukprot:COSAG04_NODE_981_length_9013_cov_4.862928_5_plen_89_part_00
MLGSAGFAGSAGVESPDDADETSAFSSIDQGQTVTLGEELLQQGWRRFGGFFAVFAVAIWRWRKRLKFNVENSVGAPWLLSARQKLAW